MDRSDNPDGAAGQQTGLSDQEALQALMDLEQDDTAPADDADSDTSDVQEDLSATDDDDIDIDDADPENEGDDESDDVAEEDEDQALEDQEDEDAEEGSLDDDVQVTLSDGTTATLEELKQSYHRQADYTRKTQALAEDRKHVEAVGQEVVKLRDETYKQAEFLQQELEHLVPPELADDIWQTDPIGAPRLKEERREKINDLLQRYRKYEAVKQQKLQEDQHQAEQNRLAAIDIAVKARPHLSNENAVNEYGDRVKSTLKELGFSADDIRGLMSHPAAFNLVDAAIDGIKYKKTDKPKARAKLKGKPRLKRSGARRSANKAQRAKVNQHMNELRNTGSDEAAVAALEARFGKG